VNKISIENSVILHSGKNLHSACFRAFTYSTYEFGVIDSSSDRFLIFSVNNKRCSRMSFAEISSVLMFSNFNSNAVTCLLAYTDKH